MARGTCHVALIGLKFEPSSVRRSRASNGTPPIPIGLAVGAPETNMLEQNNTQTLAEPRPLE